MLLFFISALLLVLFFLAYNASSLRVTRSLNPDSTIYWNNPLIPANFTLDPSLGVTQNKLIAALVVDGPLFVNGPIILPNYVTGGYYIQQELNTGVPYPWQGLGSSGSSSVPSIYPVVSGDVLCGPENRIGIDCPWRTNWNLWSCHPDYPICICPFNITQDQTLPTSVRHVSWIWPTTTPRSVFELIDYRPLCPHWTQGLPANVVSNPWVDVRSQFCYNPSIYAVACHQNQRNVGFDARYNNYWPRILGPEWMYTAFDRLDSHGYYLVAWARDTAARCDRSGLAYMALTDPATRTLTATCDKASASIFTVKRSIAPVTAANDGIAIYVSDANNVTLAATNYNVCWGWFNLRVCDTEQVWRRTFWTTDNFAVLQPSTDVSFPSISLVFLRTT